MDKLFEVHTQYTKDRFMEGSAYQWKTDLRISLLPSCILIAAVVLSYVMYLVWNGSKPILIAGTVLVLSVIMLFFALILKKVIARTTKKKYYREKFRYKDEMAVAAFYPEYMEIFSEQYSLRIFYQQIKRFYQTPDFYYLDLGFSLETINKHNVTQGDAAAFTNFMENKLVLPQQTAKGAFHG